MPLSFASLTSLTDEADGPAKKIVHAKSKHLTESENLLIQTKVLKGQCIEGPDNF